MCWRDMGLLWAPDRLTHIMPRNVIGVFVSVRVWRAPADFLPGKQAYHSPPASRSQAPLTPGPRLRGPVAGRQDDGGLEVAPSGDYGHKPPRWHRRGSQSRERSGGKIKRGDTNARMYQ